MVNNIMDGLSISEDEFVNLKQKEQNLILFRNINEIKKAVSGYKLYYKVTAIIGSILIFGIIMLFRLQVGA